MAGPGTISSYDTVHEFYGPFAHIEGRFEWCRIRSPTHGVFDCFILIERRPVVVYVRDAPGEAFMRDRYPECQTYRVPASNMSLREENNGRGVRGQLRAARGPVRTVELLLVADPTATAREVAYGGGDKPVWGSATLSCWGVDLVLDGTARGHIEFADGRVERFNGERALVTLGSFGRISPLPAATLRRAKARTPVPAARRAGSSKARPAKP